MNIRKLTSRRQDESPDESENKEVEKPKRTRIKKKEEKQKSPLSGALALTVLAGIGILFFFSTFLNGDPQVKGVKTEREKIQSTQQASEAASTIRGRLEDRIDSIKERVSELDPEDAVENAPQINKLIEDLQALQQTPSEGLENACHAVCESIDQRE